MLNDLFALFQVNSLNELLDQLQLEIPDQLLALLQSNPFNVDAPSQPFLSPQLYTPGSDIAIGFRPSQIIWGRTGNDALLGYQPPTSNPQQLRIDLLLGDLAIDDFSTSNDNIPPFREWSDTFILGDWTQPYYAAGNPFFLGLNNLAVIPDFNPTLDSIQLHGNQNNYQLLEVGLGTAIAFQQGNALDVVGFLLGTSGLSLVDNYFQFTGFAPPTPIAVPQTQQFGTTQYDIPLGISTDPDGNVYVAGGTNGSLFSPNAGLRDNFVTKYDSQGNVLFTQQFGTNQFDTIYGIETDNDGNYYVAGVTEGELAGPLQANSVDSFVAKFDRNGNQQWIRQIGQNEIFNAFNLAVDQETGDAFISGANVKPSIENPDDSFIIKFDTNGNQQWFTEIGTSGFLNFDETYGLTVGSDGNVYATGWTVGNLGGPNQGRYDNWLARLDNTTGAVQWIEQYGTPDYEWAWDVRTDSQGNVYTAGWTLGNLGGTSAGSFDAYLAKFDNAGNQQWIRQFGTPGDDEAYSLFIDSEDNLFLGGYTDNALGGPNAGSFDAWIAHYDTNGNQSWITQFGTPDRDELYGISVDHDGNLYATGITQGSLGGVNAGSFDGWVAKLDKTQGTLLNFSGSPNGAGGQTTLTIAPTDNPTIVNFTGVGTGTNPSPATIAEVDTLKFTGRGLVARNLLLTQQGSDLVVSFDGVAGTQVILKNFELEDLDNLRRKTGAAVDLGNILFDGQNQIQDSFDVFNRGWNREQIFNRNSVTFLNDLDNKTRGFEHSNDVINAQGGNDYVYGLSGDDILRGGEGADWLDGGAGNDILTGNAGADRFVFSSYQSFTKANLGVDTITDFNALAGDKIVLSKGTFTALNSAIGGALSASDFAIVNAPTNGSAGNLAAKIIYNQGTGDLIYNANSSTTGLGGGGRFATLTANPLLTQNHFLVRA